MTAALREFIQLCTEHAILVPLILLSLFIGTFILLDVIGGIMSNCISAWRQGGKQK